MYLKTQKFLIMGASKSGYAAAEYLISNGADCSFYEELSGAKVEASVEKLLSIGAKRVSAEEAPEAVSAADVIIMSPGVPINHGLAVSAKQQGKRIIGELEFGLTRFVPTLVAVTGTNGKTTTVNLIDGILKNAGIKEQLVGNVGVPVTGKVREMDSDTVCVAEVSSFQLETSANICPHIACILNISPDHLERHYTMENYIFLKKRIFKNQKESEYTVLNYDDETVRSFVSELKSKAVWVSVRGKVDGAYRENGKLYWKGEYILDEAEMRLKGDHNVADALFAAACARLLGVPAETIADTLKNFKGVRHRVELIAEKNGVAYYNDSKATNTASTISALDMMKSPTVLILGGSEKGENYRLLFEKVKESPVKHVVLTGASRFHMLDEAGKVGVTDVTVTGDFFFAVKIASILAKEGENVLLSPACASFDAFGGYEERGDAFVKAVEELA